MRTIASVIVLMAFCFAAMFLYAQRPDEAVRLGGLISNGSRVLLINTDGGYEITVMGADDQNADTLMQASIDAAIARTNDPTMIAELNKMKASKSQSIFYTASRSGTDFYLFKASNNDKIWKAIPFSAIKSISSQ